MRGLSLALCCLWFSPLLNAQACYPPALDHGDPRDIFGSSVALNGDHAAVLASGDQAIYVYRRTGGLWRRSARIALPAVLNPLASDSAWINAAGNELLVGSPAADAAAVSRAGVVYRYVRGGETWTAAQTLTATAPQADAYFGGRLTLAGDYLVIGSHNYDQPGFANAGAAYVFQRQPDGTFGSPLALADPTPSVNGRYGLSLSSTSQRLIIGASTDSGPNGAFSGSVFVYAADANPQLLQTLNQPGEPAGTQFGASISASGNRLLLSNNVTAGPVVFHYQWDGQRYAAATAPVLGLTESERILDSAMQGDIATLGIVPVSTSTAGINERVLVIDLATNQVRSIAAPNPGAGLDAAPSFGGSLALDGDTLLAGAAGTDIGAGRDQGVAWLYRLGDGSVIRRLRHGAGRAPAEFGVSVASGADGRIWVGEPGFDSSREDSGRVIELIPAGDGWSSGRSVASPSAQEGFGARIALSGELLAVVSDRATVAGVAGYGRVHVLRIAATGVEPVCELSPASNPEVSQFGALIAASGNRVAVAHGPTGNRRVHVYEVSGAQCSPLTTISAGTLGAVNSVFFAASIGFVGEHLAIGNPRFAPPTTMGQVFVLKPQVAGAYNLLTTLAQTGSPAMIVPMGTSLSASPDLLAVMRPPNTLNGIPRAGALLTWSRVGDSYTPLGTAVDPATPGSVEWSGFALPLVAGTRIYTHSRDSAGRSSFLYLTTDQPNVLKPGLTLAENGNASALYASGDRVGAGLGTLGSTFAPWRGGLGSARVTLDGFQALAERPGSDPDVLHCADFDEVED